MRHESRQLVGLCTIIIGCELETAYRDNVGRPDPHGNETGPRHSSTYRTMLDQ